MTKRGSAEGRWAGVGRIALFMIGCVVLLVAASPLNKWSQRFDGDWALVAIGLPTALATLALTALFVRWDGLRLEDVGAAFGPRSLARLAVGFAVGLMLVGTQTLMVRLAGHVTWVRGAGGAGPAAVALGGYLLLASREELAFHGYPLRRLDRLVGWWVAQLVVALIFAAEHMAGGYSLTNALWGAFVGSLLFGMASLATRGLAVPLGVHAAWNFGQWVLGEKGPGGLWKPVVDAGYKSQVDRHSLICYVLVFATATVAFWGWGRRKDSEL